MTLPSDIKATSLKRAQGGVTVCDYDKGEDIPAGTSKTFDSGTVYGFKFSKA